MNVHPLKSAVAANSAPLNDAGCSKVIPERPAPPGPNLAWSRRRARPTDAAAPSRASGGSVYPVQSMSVPAAPASCRLQKRSRTSPAVLSLRYPSR